MLAPPTPVNERERVEALQSLDILYSPAEERFDRITRIAQRLFDVPIALVSLVSSEKQWFKSKQGLTVCETNREISFCGHAIQSDDTFVIPNALKDPDFSDNPLVTGEPRIRFYAGQPIRSQGNRIGTLCVIDSKPRQMRPKDYDSLKSLASWVEIELEALQEKPASHLHELHDADDRQLLVDAVTGCINERGLATVLSQMQSLRPSEELRLLTLSISNIEERCPPSELPNRLQGCAQALRTELNLGAELAILDNNDFVIVPLEQSEESVHLSRGKIYRAMAQNLPASTTTQFRPEFNIEISAHTANPQS